MFALNGPLVGAAWRVARGSWTAQLAAMDAISDIYSDFRRGGRWHSSTIGGLGSRELGWAGMGRHRPTLSEVWMSDLEQVPTVTARPFQLRDGNWGVRVYSGNLSEGDLIEVRPRSGRFYMALVRKVIWQGKSSALALVMERRESPCQRSSGPSYHHDLSSGPATASNLSAPVGDSDGRPSWVRNW